MMMINRNGLQEKPCNTSFSIKEAAPWDHSTPAAILTQYKKSIADLPFIDGFGSRTIRKVSENSATTAAAGDPPFLYKYSPRSSLACQLFVIQNARNTTTMSIQSTNRSDRLIRKWRRKCISKSAYCELKACDRDLMIDRRWR